MYDQLPILLQLQEVDGEIDRLESEKARIPIELKALESRLGLNFIICSLMRLWKCIEWGCDLGPESSGNLVTRWLWIRMR